jgi:hypothetical protein
MMSSKKTQSGKPSANGSIGRDSKGRFVAGNRGGPGNPYGRQVAKLRSALLSAVDPKDIKQIVAKLIVRSKEGDIVAIRELLDRCIGKAVEMDFIERLEKLEDTLNDIAKSTQQD